MGIAPTFLGILLAICGSSHSWGQAPSSKEAGNSAHSRNRIHDVVTAHPEKIPELVAEAVGALRTGGNDNNHFNLNKTFLINLIQEIQGNNQSIAPDTANQAAEALIDIYKMQWSQYPERGTLVVDFVARFANSPRSEEFVLAGLSGKTPGLLEPTTTALCWSQSFRGNPRIMAALGKNLKVHPNDALTLAAMSRLDLNSTRQKLIDQIKGARDVRGFNEIAGIVSQTHDPALVKELLLRVKSFKITGRDEFTNPYIGIYSEAIAAYIDVAEDSDLELVLEILPITGAGVEEKAALLGKLERGRSSQSRQRTADAIAALARQGILRTPDVADKLERQARQEKDPSAASAMERAAKAARMSP